MRDTDKECSKPVNKRRKLRQANGTNGTSNRVSSFVHRTRADPSTKHVVQPAQLRNRQLDSDPYSEGGIARPWCRVRKSRLLSLQAASPGNLGQSGSDHPR